MHLVVDPIELTVHTAVPTQYNGKIEWSVVRPNETSKRANTHTLTLRLTPVWKTAEGVLLSDCALESTGPVDNTLGPQAVLITDTDTVNSPPPVPGSMNHLGLPLATQ